MIAIMEIITYELKTKKLKKSMRPFRLVFLSDLHNRAYGEQQQELLEAIDMLNPDMILCTGDMLTAEKKAAMDAAIQLFEGLAKRRVPVICSNGNHESRMRQRLYVYGKQYQEYAQKLHSMGIQILVNEKMDYPVNGKKLSIYGYELPLKYYKKFGQLPYDEKDLLLKFGVLDESAFHILLAHNPVYFDSYAAWGADLTLSGHLHGGIIRLPLLGGLITPQAKLFPKYDRGLFEQDDKYLVVSGGLGEHTVPIRFMNPRQLICIELRGTD